MKKLFSIGLSLFVAAIILSGCSKTEEVKIPENCTSWFDGCNNCTVKDWKAEACTMMYCEKPTAGKCTQFKE